MKKNYQWMLAAMLFGGLSLTSCSLEDNPAGPAEEVDPYVRTTTVFDFEDDTTPFTGRSRITAAVGTHADWESKVATFVGAGNAQNGYSFADFNFTELVPNAAVVTVNFDYIDFAGRSTVTIGDALVRGTTGGSSKQTYNKTGAIFSIGTTNNGRAFHIGDNQSYTTADFSNKWLNVNVVINNFDRTVVWVVKDKATDEILAQSGTTAEPAEEGAEAEFVPGTVGFVADDANEATQIDVWGYLNNNGNCNIDNLSIESAVDPSVKYADYNVKYIDAAGNELQEARVGNGRVGTGIELLASDKTSLYNADKTKKYIYESDNAAETTIAEQGTVVTVKFRDAKLYTVAYNLYAGSTAPTNLLGQVRQENCFEDDTYNLYPATVQKFNDQYYGLTPSSYNGVSFSATPNDSENVRVVDGVNYIIKTGIYNPVDTIAYFADLETLALPVEDAGNGTGLGQLSGTVNSWWSFSGGYFDRFSGGRAIRLDEGSYVWTEPIAAGTYRVEWWSRADTKDLNEAPAFGLRDAAGKVTLLTIEVPQTTAGLTEKHTISGVTIPEGNSLVIMNNGNATTLSIDNVLLVKE